MRHILLVIISRFIVFMIVLAQVTAWVFLFAGHSNAIIIFEMFLPSWLITLFCPAFLRNIIYKQNMDLYLLPCMETMISMPLLLIQILLWTVSFTLDWIVSETVLMHLCSIPCLHCVSQEFWYTETYIHYCWPDMSCFQGLLFCPEAASLLLHNFCIYHISPPGHEVLNRLSSSNKVFALCVILIWCFVLHNNCTVRSHSYFTKQSCSIGWWVSG